MRFSTSISETVRDRPMIITDTNRKSWVAERSVSTTVTLSDLELAGREGQICLQEWRSYSLTWKDRILHGNTAEGEALCLAVNHAPSQRTTDRQSSSQNFGTSTHTDRETTTKFCMVIKMWGKFLQGRPLMLTRDLFAVDNFLVPILHKRVNWFHHALVCCMDI